MIIHRPDIKIENDEVCVSAKLEFQSLIKDMPDELWFRFPSQYSEFAVNYADGFAVSLLLLAMVLGEDLVVRGELSQRLLYGMKEYQRIFNLWYPHKYKIIDIKFDSLRKQNDCKTKGAVACAFSGGVDSFYTLWTHLPKNEILPAYRLTHALFVHGFDIPLADLLTYSACKQSYIVLMKNLGLELVTASTNIIQFLRAKIGRGYACGVALTGVVLILQRLFLRFYVPATVTYKKGDLFAWGSHPLLDSLLSTEALEIIHDGASIARADKTIALAEWPLTYSLLRVCMNAPTGLTNCCRCKKCVCTMIPLQIYGALNKYSAFPLKLRRRDIRSYSCWFDYYMPFIKENIAYAIKMKKIGIVFDLCFFVFLSKTVFYSTRLMSYFIPLQYIEQMKNRIKALLSRLSKREH